MRCKVVAEIKRLETKKDLTVVLDADDKLRIARLRGELQRLDALSKQTRAQWLRALSAHLMSMCQLGHAQRGNRKNPPPQRQRAGANPKFKRSGGPGGVHLRQLAEGQRLYCESKLCSSRANPKPASKGAKGKQSARGKRVRFACKCTECAKFEGVVMCFDCHSNEAKHKSAVDAVEKSAKKRHALKWWNPYTK